MRYIKKQASSNPQLSIEHATPPQTSLEAKTRWGGFQLHRAALRNELLQEQLQLCCYSEIRADRLGLGHHIEHVEPKSKNPQRTFDYSNLAASALTHNPDLKTFKDQGHERFGGHARKDDHYDASLFVSCHQIDCARFFVYSSLGRVEPAIALTPQDSAKAQHTIDDLKLNSPYLVTLRKNWFADLVADVARARNDGTIEMLPSFYLLPSNNQLNEFFSLTRQFFGPAAEQVLQQTTPSLI